MARRQRQMCIRDRERRWTEGSLPLWLIATGGGIAAILVVGLFFAGSYNGVGAGG